MTNPAVLVWSLPSCVQCLSTKRQLEKHGIAFIERDLTEHPDQADAFRAEGLTTAPIVQTSIGIWQGFRPDLIKQLANADR